MHIAILMPGGYALSRASDGRKAQILYQADALERLRHHVVRLNPWDSFPLEELDAVHVVEGGMGNIAGVFGPNHRIKKMGMATFVDTNCPSWMYRGLALAGRLHPRLMTQQALFWRQAKACDIVIARSRDERRLLVHGIGIPAEKVKIVLNGVNPPAAVDINAVRQKFAIEGDFALHISAFSQARKNVVRLIEAAGALDIPLIIGGTAGAPGEANAVLNAAKRHPKVRFVGTLTALERDSLYAACRVFCLPSLYEGTGLVALEAASHGAKVVITRCGGPPDYFADLVEYVNPASVPSIRGAIERAWAAPADGRLKAHVLEKLSWDQSAAALAQAYQ